MTGIDLLIAGLAVIGIWLGGVAALAMKRLAMKLPDAPPGQIGWSEKHSTVTADLSRLSILQKRLLVFLSAGVSALTLGSGLLRAAELVWNPSRVPASVHSLLLGGGLFAVLIALSYAPTIINAQDTRSELLSKTIPVPTEAMTSEWCERRELIERVLLPPNSSGTGIQVSIAVLAPVVAALTTALYSLR